MKATKEQILRLIKGRGIDVRGMSVAEICREINQKQIFWCGRRKCGFPNPRKRKVFTLHETDCDPKYSAVCAAVKALEKEGVVVTTKELWFDKFKSRGALDPRKVVRLKEVAVSLKWKKRAGARTLQRLLVTNSR